MSGNGLRNVFAAVRMLGIFVIFLTAFSLGAPGAAAFSCSTYTMEECVSQSTCEDVAGESCGSAIPGCGGKGTIACGFSNCSGGNVTMICQFDPPH